MAEKFERFTIKNSIINLEKVDFNDVKSSKNPIIFDTNFLFVPFEFKVDVIGEILRLVSSNFNLFIYEGTISELEAIEKKKDKNKKFLPLIITMLKNYNFKIIKSQISYIDEQILSNLNKNVLIATNDKQLRLKIQKERFKVLYLRQKMYLEIK